MEKINRQAKTVGCWEEILVPIEVEALHDTYHTNPEEVLTPNEVLDIMLNFSHRRIYARTLRHMLKHSERYKIVSFGRDYGAGVKDLAAGCGWYIHYLTASPGVGHEGEA